MSDPAEIEQAILDIVTFQYKKADKKIKVSPAATRGQGRPSACPFARLSHACGILFVAL